MVAVALIIAMVVCCLGATVAANLTIERLRDDDDEALS